MHLSGLFSEKQSREAAQYMERLRRMDKNKDHIERTKRMIEVMQAYVGGEAIDCKQRVYCDPFVPNWNWSAFDFFVAKTPDTISWDHVAPEFKYMERDEYDDCRIYECHPNSKANNYIMARSFTSYRKGTVDWKDSLVIRPGCE